MRGSATARRVAAAAVLAVAGSVVAGDAPAARAFPAVRVGFESAARSPGPIPAAPSAFRTSLPAERLDAALGSFRHSGEFYREHLLPKLEARLRDVAWTSPDMVLGLLDGEGAAFEAAQDLAERRAVSAARRALKEFALDETGLERRAERWLDGRKEALPDRWQEGPKVERDGWRFRVGSSSGLPRFDWITAVGRESSLRLRLHADGRVGLDLSNPGARRSKLTFDADLLDGRYAMGWRAAF